jgi:NADH-quinone oxidoreductase subunit C
MAETSPELQLIQDKLGAKIFKASEPQGDHVIVLDRIGLRDSFRLLKEDDDLGFNFLSDITAVDYWKKQEPRFEVVYQLVSFKKRRRLRIRVGVPESEAHVESMTPLWRGANFLEREIWDLYGIHFSDHPDLRRILLYDEFVGHPLRKDYPVNLWQPRVPERHVDGTFVDERSHNKLRLLQKKLANKN